MIWIWLFELERGLFRFYLALLCIGLVRRVVRAMGVAPRRPPEPATWPSVTVQVLLCDEPQVAARALAHAAALRYPGELTIDVLDDSADPAARQAVDRAADGLAVRVLRRGDRKGHKAGNLAAGLAQARGELIAVFDADARPSPDFLVQIVPQLVADARVGLVQAAHTFDNRDANLLTRGQALLLDGLMRVEQPGQSRRGRPLHFNGSAGVWRRACIEEAGGWRDETSAEDLDLSHRAVLAGWRLVHLAEVTVATELPGSMAAFRVQQARWTRGKLEVLRRRVGEIVRSPLPIGARIDLLVPATARLIFPFLFLLTLTMPLTTFNWVRPLVRYGIADGAATLGVVGACAALYYRRAGGSVLGVPLVIALLFGLSLSSTVAFVTGLFSRKTTFLRTPKGGDAVALPVGERVCAWVEVLIGLAYVGFTGMAVHGGLYPAAGFFAFVAAAWLWVGVGTLRG